ncbi:hypothetical protein GNI_160640 [Gregarina niphandrodes]|uniref:Reverse transcriptase RNase H-like domain-containing protein n=1 Tax=Gregarina niphandrodes TaxID=110365 RepID=A0A023AYI9_GRENI|nr:hypothetical protein GNI_160640 [Gregarina niphandrodes]EZG43737.1 hypothetical protein GNI_160640 [Gregarina niphandrodes]|eukprot:XP_011133024.1 hypothetical protein GNI_160640 [Gregarina niphandrodes]
MSPTDRTRPRSLLVRYRDTWESLRVAQAGCEAFHGEGTAVQVAYEPPGAGAARGAQVKKQLELGVIRPSKSEWAAAPHFVKKRTGEWQCVLDYRRVNESMSFSVRCQQKVDNVRNAEAPADVRVKRVVDKWEDYVALAHFTVRTDHGNLRYLTGVDKGKNFRWTAALSQLDFTLEFMPQEKSCMAGWLSRSAAEVADDAIMERMALEGAVMAHVGALVHASRPESGEMVSHDVTRLQERKHHNGELLPASYRSSRGESWGSGETGGRIETQRHERLV